VVRALGRPCAFGQDEGKNTGSSQFCVRLIINLLRSSRRQPSNYMGRFGRSHKVGSPCMSHTILVTLYESHCMTLYESHYISHIV
jgi:hypothetical protein